MIIWSNLTFIANCEKTNNFLQNCSLAENKLKIDRANFDLSIETTRKIILENYDNKLWLAFTKVKLALIIYDLSPDFTQC